MADVACSPEFLQTLGILFARAHERGLRAQDVLFHHPNVRSCYSVATRVADF